jgi:ribosomal protein S18 acetylase RimI-like enzyme
MQYSIPLLITSLTLITALGVPRTTPLFVQCHQSRSKTTLTMIQPTKKDETAALMSLAEASGLFEPSQTEELAQMLNRHFDDAASPEIWLTQFDPTGGTAPELPNIIGMAYIAPERMTEGTWNLLLLAIHPDHQKKGFGKALLHHVEHLLAKQGERVLLVETSGTDDFDYVRSFYRNSGYDEEARIREFYAAGVDKIIFRKALN